MPLALRCLVLCSWVAFVACGVRFTASEGNEFFTSIDVTGEMRAGSPLTGAIAYDQTYPTDVLIRCEIRQSGEFVKPAGESLAAAHPAGRPDATPVPGTLSFDFTVDAPGTYIFQCFTPKDEENFIEESFAVEAAADAEGGATVTP